MKEELIPDCRIIKPHHDYLDQFGNPDYGLYYAKDKVSSIDSRTLVLDVPQIIVASDTEEGGYIIVNGQHRTTLATLYKIGLESYFLESEDDCRRLPLECYENLSCERIAANYRMAQYYKKKMQDEGCTFAKMTRQIKKEFLDKEMIRKYLSL